jgi:hypothetical protein
MNASSRPSGFQAIKRKAVKALAASFVIASSFGLPALAAPNITRYALDYTTVNGTGFLKGYMDIDINDPLAKNDVIGGLFPTWFDKLVLNYNDGTTTTTLTKTDFDSLNWQLFTPGTVDWASSLLGQFADINFGYVGGGTPPPITAFNTRLIGTDDDMNTFLLSKASLAVPGPLPLLGAGAAFAWSRKLRRRQAVASKSSSI